MLHRKVVATVLPLIISGVGYLYPPAAFTDVAFGAGDKGRHRWAVLRVTAPLCSTLP